MAFSDLPRDAQKAFFAKLQEREQKTGVLTKLLSVLAGAGIATGVVIGGKKLSKSAALKRLLQGSNRVKANSLNNTDNIKTVHLDSLFKGKSKTHFEKTAKYVDREIGALYDKNGRVVLTGTSNSRVRIGFEDVLPKASDKTLSSVTGMTHNHPTGVITTPDGRVAAGTLSPQDLLYFNMTTSGKLLQGTFPRNIKTFKEADDIITGKIRRKGSTGSFYISDLNKKWFPNQREISVVDEAGHTYTIATKTGKSLNELPDRALMDYHNFTSKYSGRVSKTFMRDDVIDLDVGISFDEKDLTMGFKSTDITNEVLNDFHSFLNKGINKSKGLSKNFVYKVTDKNGNDVTDKKLDLVLERFEQ